MIILWWFAHVGFETQTNEGSYWLINSKPTLREPVPDKAWTVTILPDLTASLFSPKTNLCEWVLNPGRPSIGIYY